MTNTYNITKYLLNNYQEALKEKQLIPINQGKVSKLDFEGEKTDFSFVIEFEIRPNVDKKIPNYEKKITRSRNFIIVYVKNN